MPTQGILYTKKPFGTSMRLSVVMCNYNFGRYIESALEGFAQQTKFPDELILIDDASTDNSRDIIESYVRNFPQIIFIKNEKRRGAYESANRGLHRAKGEYIYFACSDDFILPNFIEITLSSLKAHPEAGFACSEPFYFHKKKEGEKCNEQTSFPSQFYPREEVAKFKQENHTFLGHTSIYKRSYVLQAGGVQKNTGPLCDWFFSHVIALRHGFVFIKAVLAHKRLHDENLSHPKNDRKKPCLYILESLQTPAYLDVRKKMLSYSILKELRKEFIYTLFWQKKSPKTLIFLILGGIISRGRRFFRSLYLLRILLFLFQR